jgi:hypothetical protein
MVRRANTGFPAGFSLKDGRKGGFVKDVAGWVLAVDNRTIFLNLGDNLQLSSMTPAAPSG